MTDSNTRDIDVADLAIGLMIMTSRRLAQADRFVRAGRWLKEKFPVAGKVTGKKLGILGLGRIGRAIAARAEGFGMEILYTDRARLNTKYRFLPDLISLARESDFLMIATSAGPDARHMVNAPVLEALGPEGILISRDDVVLLPHIASSTRETRSEMGRLAISNLEAWFSGKPLVNPVPETLAMLANR